MVKLSAAQVIFLMENTDKYFFQYVEEQAIKNYAESPGSETMIAKAWIKAIVDSLDKAHLAVYHMKHEDLSNRVSFENSPGARILSFRKN